MLDIPTKIKYTIYKLTVRNVKNEKGGECNVGKKYENGGIFAVFGNSPERGIHRRYFPRGECIVPEICRRI